MNVIYEFGACPLAGIVAALITLGQFGCLLRRLGGIRAGRDTGRGHSSGERVAHEPPPPLLTLLPTPKVSEGGGTERYCLLPMSSRPKL